MPRFTTSGTTARKEFELPDELMVARVARLASTKGKEFAGLKSIFCALTPSSTAATRYRAYCAHAGVTFYAPCASMAETLQVLANKSIDGLIGWPVDLLRYARELKGARRFPYLLAGGDRLGTSTAREIRSALLTEDGAAYSSYGASEVGTIALAPFAVVEIAPRCVGRPCEGNQVEVVEGQIRVKTPTMIGGYDNTDLTRHHFRDGWFWPGDLGRFTNDGLLFVEGRV